MQALRCDHDAGAFAKLLDSTPDSHRLAFDLGDIIPPATASVKVDQQGKLRANTGGDTLTYDLPDDDFGVTPLDAGAPDVSSGLSPDVPFFAGFLAVAVVRFVIDHEDIFHPHEAGHHPLEHLSLGFHQGVKNPLLGRFAGLGRQFVDAPALKCAVPGRTGDEEPI